MRIDAVAGRETYIVSLLISDENDDPARPTVLVGSNTETRVRECAPRVDLGAARFPRAMTPSEARWNYAYFLQNELAWVGDAETDARGVALRQAWIERLLSASDRTSTYEQWETISTAFAELLVCVVKGIHSDGFVEDTFGRAIPVLLHSLEYGDETTLERNRRANPPEVLVDFEAAFPSL